MEVDTPLSVEYAEQIPLRTLRLRLWVNVAVYFVAFTVTVIVAIHIEGGYASDMDFAFVECNVVTTFVVTAVFAFCGLNEVFILNEENQRSAIVSESIELDSFSPAKGMGATLLSNANRSDTDGAARFVKESAVENMQNLPKNTECCHLGKSLGRWLLEKKERSDPQIYGERVLYRRFFLLVGTIGFGYSVCDQMYNILTTTVKEEVRMWCSPQPMLT